jgi:major intracellular serine protease
MYANHTHRAWRGLVVVLGIMLLAATARAIPVSLDQIGVLDARLAYPTVDGVDDQTGQVQRIAIVDTGIDWTHDALSGQVVDGINFAANALWGATDPASYIDRNGHGTFISGIVAANDPAYTGVAPKVELVAVRVLAENGAGLFADIPYALKWINSNADALNITAVNISVGSATTYSSSADLPATNTIRDIRDELSELKRRNIVTVAASGNQSSTTGLSLISAFDELVAVGAVDAADAIWSKTNRNSELELLAPGVDIESLWLDDGHARSSGTSYAAGFVTATAALVRDLISAHEPTLEGDFATFQDRFVDIMQQTGVKVDDPAGGLSFARLDLMGALDELSSDYHAPEPASAMVMAAGVFVLLGRRRKARAN